MLPAAYWMFITQDKSPRVQVPRGKAIPMNTPKRDHKPVTTMNPSASFVHLYKHLPLSCWQRASIAVYSATSFCKRKYILVFLFFKVLNLQNRKERQCKHNTTTLTQILPLQSIYLQSIFQCGGNSVNTLRKIRTSFTAWGNKPFTNYVVSPNLFKSLTLAGRSGARL